MKSQSKLCECGCGQFTGVYSRTDARWGHVKGEFKKFVKGHSHRGQMHGMTDTPEYKAYADAKDRCTNPKADCWKHYGGRGIKFLFTRFSQFFSEIGSKPKDLWLDRINNEGHYEVGNVQWTTPSASLYNRRHLKISARKLRACRLSIVKARAARKQEGKN